MSSQRANDIFHTYKSTNLVNELYPLLDMSSDALGTARLLSNYKIPWKELFKGVLSLFLVKIYL
jgi:hypothetical protein